LAFAFFFGRALAFLRAFALAFGFAAVGAAGAGGAGRGGAGRGGAGAIGGGGVIGVVGGVQGSGCPNGRSIVSSMLAVTWGRFTRVGSTLPSRTS
jgi:hypothetical protein